MRRHYRHFPELYDAAWMRNAYETEGKGVRAIAAELGCYVASVGQALRRHNITPRPAGAPRADPRASDETWLREALKTRYVYEIAAELGTCNMTIYRSCRKFGIEHRRGYPVRSQ